MYISQKISFLDQFEQKHHQTKITEQNLLVADKDSINNRLINNKLSALKYNACKL